MRVVERPDAPPPSWRGGVPPILFFAANGPREAPKPDGATRKGPPNAYRRALRPPLDDLPLPVPSDFVCPVVRASRPPVVENQRRSLENTKPFRCNQQ